MSIPSRGRRARASSAVLKLLLALSLCPPSGAAQTEATPPPSPEMRYYDFWPGDWAEVVGGSVKQTVAFRVRRSVHDAAYEEEWWLGAARPGSHAPARAIRAWDQITNRWMFVWVSPNALFQVWEGRKYDGRWYIVREFEIGGRRFLSRQAWWPVRRDRVVWVMERSFDSGVTWETRLRAEYARVRRAR